MYYYFLASLPYLQFGQQAPLGLDKFMHMSANLLKASDFQELEALLENNQHKCSSAFAQKWFALDTQIRNNLVKARANKLQVEASDYLYIHSGYSIFVDKMVKEALEQDNPLKMERELDRGRWQLISELSLNDHFGLDSVLCFGLQLKILHRWTALEAEQGRKRLENIIRSNTAEIQKQD